MNPFTPKDRTSLNQHSHRRLTPFAQIALEVAGGTALLGLGAFLIAGVWAVYVVAALAAAALAIIALVMSYVVIDTASETKGNRWTILFSGGAALIAVVWGYAAIVAFSVEPLVPGFIATGLYGAALAAGIWKELDRAERIIAALLGALIVAVATSTIVIPGRDEATGEPPGFSVKIAVEDERSPDMKTDIVANCTLLDIWSLSRGELPGADAKIIDNAGHAGPWTFKFGHPFKAVLCTVIGQRQPQDGESETRGVSKTLYFPLPGGDYTLNLLLFNSDRL